MTANALANSLVRMPTSLTKEHFPVLDGTRAMAFLFVVIFHSFEVWDRTPPVGMEKYFNAIGHALWFGVDLFFVLSGFLITTILLAEKNSANYFRRFYFRRTIRIFPLYYAFLIILFFAIYLSTDEGHSIFSVGHVSYWIYLENIWFSISGWDSFRGINHLWSLALEEQFYLIWPAAVLLLSARQLKYLIGIVIVGAILLRAVLSYKGGYSVAIYVSTLTRVDCLVAGALLALLASSPGGRQWVAERSPKAFYIGLSAMILIFIWRGGYRISDPAIQIVGLSLNAFTFAALIAMLCFSTSGNSIKMILSSKFLRWIGNRSYAGYLFHFPVVIGVQKMIYVSTQILGIGVCLTFVCAMLITLALAEASWQWYESFWLKVRDSVTMGNHQMKSTYHSDRIGSVP